MRRGFYLFVREWRGMVRRPMGSVASPQSGANAVAADVHRVTAAALWKKYGRGAVGALVLSLLAPLTLLSE